jgi:hypothetical protein
MNLLPEKKYRVPSRNFVKRMFCAKKVTKLPDLTVPGTVLSQSRQSRVLGFLSSSPNWDPLTRRRVCPPSLVHWGDTLACGRGCRGVPIRTRGQTLWYSRYTLCVLLSPIPVHEKQWLPLGKVQHSRDYRDTRAKSGHHRKVFNLLVFACLCQQWKLDGGRGIDWCREANIRDGLETVPSSLITVQKPAVGAGGVIPPSSPPSYFSAAPWIFRLKTT